MFILRLIITLVLAYLFGSLPMGYIFVKLIKGEDIRKLGSGRTGATNVFRVGGVLTAVLTGVADAVKGGCAVWLAQWLFPGNHWIEIAAGVLAIIGHNYSIFIGFKGGAGGAPAIGGAVALWPWSVLIVVPLGYAMWYGIGYASVSTMGFSVIITVIMACRWYFWGAPWEHILYGLAALAISVWALRPNIRRLMRGEERVVGWRAKKKASTPKPE